jgi:hypothetical protein
VGRAVPFEGMRLLTVPPRPFSRCARDIIRPFPGLQVSAMLARGARAGQTPDVPEMPEANEKRGAKPKPKLLSGGNPQIPKGEGEGPVRAYIAAMPGWKRPLGKRLDALIVQTVPDVHKAVKWNQPFYGHEGEGWFLAFRCYTKYVQVQFFRGTSLDPVPPKASKHDEVRYLDIHEDDELDEAQLVSWIAQASDLPGEMV